MTQNHPELHCVTVNGLCLRKTRSLRVSRWIHVPLSLSYFDTSYFFFFPPFLLDSFSFVLFFPSRIVGVILSGRNLGKNSCGSHRHVRNSILERIAPSNFTVLHVVLPIDCRHEKVRLQRPHPQGGEPTR